MAIEKELKYSLDRASYQLLFKTFDSDSSKEEHENTYFDTPDLELREKGIGLRIRITDKKSATLTLKCNAQTTKRIKGYKVREEYNSELDLKTAKDIIAGKETLSSLKNTALDKLVEKTSPNIVGTLQAFGTLKNKRLKYRLTKELLLELDKSSVPGETFYELEVETSHPREVDEQIRQFLKSKEIPVNPSNLSKVGRLFKILNN